ncbi:MFS transporter [Salinibacterium hongtaonis]|uniref:MFS transporter n=1 Tax=Homoserinimonas hongtaonis TaxID=2079791 RepID=UPI00131F14A0|nr:MFS transporter [Salinibacterium hongtaonis]
MPSPHLGGDSAAAHRELNGGTGGARGKRNGPFRALRHRRFAIFWVAAALSTTGTWLSNLAVPFVIFEMTHSATWVGIAAAAQFIPNVLMGPLGGAWADRFDRRKVLLATQMGGSIAALLLYVVVSSGTQNAWLVILPVALQGLFTGLNMPSWQALVHDLVPREDIQSAVTLNTMQFNVGRALGPAIAGVLIGTLGTGPAFLLNSVSFFCVLFALIVIGGGARRALARPRISALRSFGTALTYIRHQRGISVAIMVSLAIGAFFNPVFNLTIILATTVYETGGMKLGIMTAAAGVGALLAGPLVAASRQPLSRVVLVGMLAVGLAVLALGAVQDYTAAVVALFAAGAGFLAVSAGVNTAIQLIVSDRMRGSVIAVRIMLYTSSMAAGALVMGAIADWLGVRQSLMLAGGALLVLGALLFVRPGAAVGRLDDPHDGSQEAP